MCRPGRSAFAGGRGREHGPRDRDLYVTAEGSGLARLNRDTGEPLWNVAAERLQLGRDRLLAVNPKFVYATDGGGRMLVLDRRTVGN